MLSMLETALNFLLRNSQNLLWALLATAILAAMLAPLETMGWWAGWWLTDSEREAAEGDDDSTDDAAKGSGNGCCRDATHYVVFLTGIGGSTEEVSVPEEQHFLQALRDYLPDICLIDDIYPYSVANRGLLENRLLARFWRWVLKRTLSGQWRLGFIINLRNLFQVLVCADDRYGAFFSNGAAKVILHELRRQGYDAEGEKSLTIIGYSGGGQIAVGAAPYLAQISTGVVQVISLGGVLSSTPLINRIDHVVHIYGTRDTVQRLGMIFPGRWRIMWLSTWNKGKRSGRIETRELAHMAHDGSGGYLDPKRTLPSGETFLAKTVETMAEIIHAEVEPIPDEPEIMGNLRERLGIS